LRSYGGLKSSNFRVFLENDPLLETFQHSILKGFIATQIDVLGSNVVKFGKWEMSKVVRYLPDKKTLRLALQISLLSGSRTKSTTAGPRQRA